MLGYV